MKTIRKKVEGIELESIQGEGEACGLAKYTYSFVSTKYIPLGNPEITVEIQEPETLKEWLKQECITKKELVEWLNEHFQNT